jgi:hypothetical protein
MGCTLSCTLVSVVQNVAVDASEFFETFRDDVSPKEIQHFRLMLGKEAIVFYPIFFSFSTTVFGLSV